MPGFIIGGTGGPGPAHTVETRRKHRWVFETIGDVLQSPELLVLREASRPHPTIQEAEMHHNQEKAWFAGKHEWEACKLVWYDTEQDPDTSRAIYNWINKVVNITAVTVAVPSVYKKEATLQMLKGDGGVSETWRMYGCWPQDINWGGLDYTATEIQTIECTMRFDRATRA